LGFRNDNSSSRQQRTGTPDSKGKKVLTEVDAWRIDVAYTRFRATDSENSVSELVAKRSLWVGAYLEWLQVETEWQLGNQYQDRILLHNIVQALWDERLVTGLYQKVIKILNPFVREESSFFLSFLRLIAWECEQKELLLLYELRILIFRLRHSLIDPDAETSSSASVDLVVHMMKRKLRHAWQAMKVRSAIHGKGLSQALSTFLKKWDFRPDEREQQAMTQWESVSEAVEAGWQSLLACDTEINKEDEIKYEGAQKPTEILNDGSSDWVIERWEEVEARLKLADEKMKQRLKATINLTVFTPSYWHYPLHRDLVECIYSRQKWLTLSLGFVHNDQDAALAISENSSAFFLTVAPRPKSDVADDDMKSHNLQGLLSSLNSTLLTTIHFTDPDWLTINNDSIPQSIVSLNGNIREEALRAVENTGHSLIYFQDMIHVQQHRALCTRNGKFIVTFVGPKLSEKELTLRIKHRVSAKAVEGQLYLKVTSEMISAGGQSSSISISAPDIVPKPSSASQEITIMFADERQPQFSPSVTKENGKNFSSQGAVKSESDHPYNQNGANQALDSGSGTLTLSYRASSRYRITFAVCAKDDAELAMSTNYYLEDIDLLLDGKPYNYRSTAPDMSAQPV
jgi:hypothetical protein